MSKCSVQIHDPSGDGHLSDISGGEIRGQAGKGDEKGLGTGYPV